MSVNRGVVLILRPYDRFPDKFQNRPQSSPDIRFSDPRDPCASVFRPQKHPVFGFLQAISMLYRYCIDTVSIQHRYSLQKSKDRVLLESENRSTGVSGVGNPKYRRALGSTWGRFGGILGRLWGSQREVGGSHRRSPAAEKRILIP